MSANELEKQAGIPVPGIRTDGENNKRIVSNKFIS
jgi:hypothetical protein